MLSTGGCLVILLLYHFSVNPNETKNGFTRKFISATPPMLYKWKTKGMVSDIAGYYQGHIFFSMPIAGNFTVAKADLSDSYLFQINLPPDANISPVFSTTIGAGNLFVFASNVPAVYRYSLSNGMMKKFKMASKFNSGIPVSPDVFMLRIMDTDLHDQVVERVTAKSGVSKTSKDITEIKNDGGFSSDGAFHYDSLTNTFIYVCFYSNRFVCFDSSLNVIYRGSTIDTDHIAVTNGSVLMSKTGKRSYTLGSPPRFVTFTSCVANGKLYCSSALKADDEKWQDFSKNSVIDCYAIKSGAYRGSFYLPRQNKERLRKFRIINDRIIALYKTCIAIYKLPS